MLLGSSTLANYYDGPAEGDALDDGVNGLDEIETEIVQLELVGDSSLGPVTLRINSMSPSLGRLEEQVNDNPGLLDVDPFAPGDASSLFDVLVELEVNDSSCRLERLGSCSPPPRNSSRKRARCSLVVESVNCWTRAVSRTPSRWLEFNSSRRHPTSRRRRSRSRWTTRL